MIYYAASTRGFYRSDIHASGSIPLDAIEVTAEQYADLMVGQMSGRAIVADETGAPVLAPEPTAAELLASRRATMVVSRFQARAALLEADLLDAANAAVAAADPIVQLAWADAQEFQRASPTIAALGAALGLTDAQIDELFESAAGITA